MNRSTVALVRCDSYEADQVYAALTRGVELLGGLDRFVRSGERILLKPNILAGEAPEKAVTTHPAVLAGCAELFQRGGATVCFGDSPGLESPSHAAEKSGLRKAGAQSGAEFVEFAPGKPLVNPHGKMATEFPVAQVIHECDGIVNLPKMKTHQLTRVTGAVKNLFGCIPGKRKALYHVQHQNVTDFCTLLTELNQGLRPRLHVMDGIVAMEGNGPRSGDPTPMRVWVLSDDPVAVDATFCRLVTMDPEFLPTTMLGYRAGLGKYKDAEIELVGDPLEMLINPSFRMVRKPVYSNATYAHYPAIRNLVLPRPYIDATKCVKCGLCVNSCPVPDKALRFENGRRDRPPVYDYERCIRCFCCHEMCPHRAIHTHTPLLGRALHLGQAQAEPFAGAPSAAHGN